ncbi:hypothetical protein [Fulvivirga ligni]|uniref:hypothetical protein n=1 Tax=Fulvivirga ligni TaxID=2904246 RepID=UPI001F38BE9C|nr:hypothetical protein [Fulvivirga ligni]UII21355.1 hypothetical protein LVD16_26335 [Fulvivirga ligni]
MNIIHQNGTETYALHEEFQASLFQPIAKYVEWKLKNDWDDYNELYHAIRFIESIKEKLGIWFHIHTIKREGEIIGVLSVVGGKIKEIEKHLPQEEQKTVLLKYFHIADKGKGYGGYWLNHVLIPYYADLGFEYIQLGSSHPKSFSFYGKLGSEISSSEKESDNHLFKRQVKAFLISIK